METASVILEGKDLSKRFGGIQALDSVGISLKKHKITALIGENGAGKSTLVKILSGYYKQDSGSIWIDEKPEILNTVDDAQVHGINVIHQVPQFALDLSVIDNIYLGKEISSNIKFKGLSRYNKKKEAETILPLLRQYDADINPLSRLKDLKAYQQRLIGIIKAMVNSARVLIMDEPTAALPLKERNKLLSNILKLKEDGYAVLYVSHILDEIEQIADEVIALRDGKLVGIETSKPTVSRMIELMTGHSFASFEQVYDASIKEHKKSKIHYKKECSNYSFTIKPPKGKEKNTVVESDLQFSFRIGEVVVLTGIVGSGIKDIAEAMYGARSDWDVSIDVNRCVSHINNPKEAIAAGVGYLSDDRKREAIIPDLSLKKNLTLPALKKISNIMSHILEKTEKQLVRNMCDQLKVKRTNIDQAILELSGGNQQKVMIGRWLFTEVQFLILNEPTQGIDIMAKQEVIKLLNDFTSENGTCLIVTNDPEEFFHTADKVIVMRKGKRVADYEKGSINKADILKAMLIEG